MTPNRIPPPERRPARRFGAAAFRQVIRPVVLSVGLRRSSGDPVVGCPVSVRAAYRAGCLRAGGRAGLSQEGAASVLSGSPGAVPPFGSERPVSAPVAPLLPVVGGGVSGRRVEFTARSVSFPGRETGLFGFFRTSFRQSHINSCICNRVIINVLKIRGGGFSG